jgi:hypothetical protein
MPRDAASRGRGVDKGNPQQREMRWEERKQDADT